MIITVDCNKDEVSFGNDITTHYYYVTQPIKTIELLVKIFEVLSNEQDLGILGVELVKIDEDTKTTVDAW